MARKNKNIKISQLTDNTLRMDDIFPVVSTSNGTTHKASIQDIKNLIGSGGSGSSGVRILTTVGDGPEADISNISEFAILIDSSGGEMVCTLPEPSLGKHYVFKKIDNSENSITIKVFDEQNQYIDGQNSQTLFYQYQSITLIGDGNNWFIL